MKNYKREAVEGQEDVELYKPGGIGFRQKKPALDGDNAETAAAGGLPLAVEDGASAALRSAARSPEVIDGRDKKKDRRAQAADVQSEPVRAPTSNLLDDIRAELGDPAPPGTAMPWTAQRVTAPPGAASPGTATPAAAPPPKIGSRPEPKPEFKPEPKPVPKKRKAMSTDPAEQGRMVAESVVGGFVGALRGQAAKRGGRLTVEDVEALSSSFERQADVLALTFEKQLKSFADARDKDHWKNERVNNLARLIVKRFSHLLVDEAELAKHPHGLSRRVLPGFFSAMAQMVGSDTIEDYERQAEVIVDKLKSRHGAAFSWDHAYAHRETKALVLDVLVAVAPHFDDLDKWLAWMDAQIKSHMPPGNPASGSPDWEIDSIGLVRLLDAVFKDLRVALEDDLGRLRITKRHGFEVLEALLEAFETFDKKLAEAGR